MKASILPFYFILSCSTVWSFQTPTRTCIFQRQSHQPATAYKSWQPARRIKCSNTRLQSTFLSTAGAAADAFWRTCPYTAAALVCGIKGSASDLVAQRLQANKRIDRDDDMEIVMNNDASISLKEAFRKFDLRRNLSYALYGALYLGLVLEHSYNHIYPRLFGAGRDIATVASKVAFDLLIQSTMLTLPIAYLIKALVFKYSFAEAMRRYVNDVMHHKLLLKYWSLWMPGMTLAFAVVPTHLRITFVAGVSFVWLIILSSTAK